MSFFINPFVNPEGDKILVGGQSWEAEDVIERLQSHMTSSRFEKIMKASQSRTLKVVAVLEDLYDRGNISAVMRSAEGLGLQNIHLVQPSSNFKESARVTQGADKWLDVKTWKRSADCVQDLKAKGFKIVVTCLHEDSKPISQVDFSKPSALVLGNELRGASKEMIELADEKVVIPMRGFTQSFNISVAAALSFYHIMNLSSDSVARASSKEAALLQALYCLKSVDSAEEILKI